MKKRKKGFLGLALVAIIISAWYFCCWESTDSLPQEVQEAAQHASWSELKRRAVVDEEHNIWKGDHLKLNWSIMKNLKVFHLRFIR